MRFRAASISVALIWSTTATVAMAEPLQPNSKWELDYGDTQCTAALGYGDASSSVILGIIPSLSGNTYELMVSVPRAGPAFAQEGQGTVDFGQGEIRTGVLYYGAKGVKQSVYQFRVSAAQIEQARSASAVSVRSENGANYAFALSNMPKLLDGLRQCTQNLQQYWNMDGKNVPSRAESATGDIRSLFTPKDYPTEALKRQQQGTAQYQLLVDEKGGIAGCDIFASSGVPVLDSTGCEVLKEKARFSPAKDGQGKPVRSVVTTPPVSWKTSDQSTFNNGCMWLTGSATGMLSTCGPGQSPPAMTPTLTAPPPPPPPPPPK